MPRVLEKPEVLLFDEELTFIFKWRTSYEVQYYLKWKFSYELKVLHIYYIYYICMNYLIGSVGLGKRSFTREVRFFIWSIQTEIGRFGSRLTSLGLRLWARVHQCISGSIRSYQGRSFRYQPPVSFKIHQLKIV